MLIEIKFNDIEKINEFINQTSLFLREFYSEILSDDEISKFQKFNKIKIIEREIKEKDYIYYLISFENKIIGHLLLCKKENSFEIMQFYLMKKYRNKKPSILIIENIKQVMIKRKINEAKIFIPETNKKLPKIVEKWGFKKVESVAKYIGDDIYIYENKYLLNI